MKILVLANNDIGLYKFRKELLEKLCESNKVFIALPFGEFVMDLVEIGCEYIQFEFNRRGTNPISDLKQIGRYKSLIKKIKPDIVLTYTIKPNVYGGMACSKTKTPYLANVTGLGTAMENGGLLKMVTTSLYRTGLKKADCVFFQNEDNQNLFRSKSLISSRTRLIPGSGVNLETHCLEEYPTEEEITRFLFVGRIMKDKGINELLKAIDIVATKGNKVFLDVVGACDEDYTDLLREYEQKGLIKYHGLQSDVHPFYKNAHCVILPSYHEGMANVLLEAAATGRPVITTRIPGCKETFEEDLTGFGCEPKSVESLVDAMEALLQKDNFERQQMGIKGRKKMEKEFDRAIIIDAYVEEIERTKMVTAQQR